MTTVKRLYRSATNKKIAGVCAGIADYLETDPTIVRLGTVVLALITAVVPFVIGYIVAWWIVPEEARTN